MLANKTNKVCDFVVQYCRSNDLNRYSTVWSQCEIHPKSAPKNPPNLPRKPTFPAKYNHEQSTIRSEVQSGAKYNHKGSSRTSELHN